jgi:hypothetical protein
MESWPIPPRAGAPGALAAQDSHVQGEAAGAPGALAAPAQGLQGEAAGSFSTGGPAPRRTAPTRPQVSRPTVISRSLV